MCTQILKMIDYFNRLHFNEQVLCHVAAHFGRLTLWSYSHLFVNDLIGTIIVVLIYACSLSLHALFLKKTDQGHVVRIVKS